MSQGNKLNLLSGRAASHQQQACTLQGFCKLLSTTSWVIQPLLKNLRISQVSALQSIYFTPKLFPSTTSTLEEQGAVTDDIHTMHYGFRVPTCDLDDKYPLHPQLQHRALTCHSPYLL